MWWRLAPFLTHILLRQSGSHFKDRLLQPLPATERF